MLTAEAIPKKLDGYGPARLVDLHLGERLVEVASW
jgi:hypothetical protein